MRYGVWVPNFGEYGDARRLAELAAEAESAGWDGFFLWDHLWRATGLEPGMPVVDPWIALAAVATSTERLRIGTMVTPVPRRRPWKLAREVATLDHLSAGRALLGVGLGSPAEHEYAAFGEDPSPHARAARLDEGLAILAGLWSGEPVRFRGDVYRVDDVRFRPRPVQSPRVPIWVAGLWPGRAPFRRAARWDGVFPLHRGRAPAPEVLREITALVRRHRDPEAGPFELVVCGNADGASGEAAWSDLPAYRDAGATWWLELLHPRHAPLARTRERLRHGPP
jgi:probable F420-dependent oxidoreductase